MAIMSTTIANGCNAVVKLDDVAGNLRDISGESNNVELDFKTDIGEFKTFATPWKGRIPCGKDASFKIKGLWSRGANELRQILNDWYFNTGGLKTFECDLPDAAVGADKYLCEVVLESFNIPAAADDAKPIMFDISLLPSGPVTWVML